MNTEYILDQFKSLLETNLASELITLQNEAGSSIVTPAPQEFKIGEHGTNVLTTFPTVLILSPYSRKRTDFSGAQDREVWFNIVCWIVSNDLENLHRFLCRYSDAISRILRNEENTPTHTHDCEIGDTTISELYPTNVGYTQGCQVQGTINYIMG